VHQLFLTITHKEALSISLQLPHVQ